MHPVTQRYIFNDPWMPMVIEKPESTDASSDSEFLSHRMHLTPLIIEFQDESGD